MSDDAAFDERVSRPRWDRQVRALLDRMTLEQKAGQLCTAMLGPDDRTAPQWAPGVLLVPSSATAARIRAYQEALARSGSGPPALPVAVGPDPPFPGILGSAAAWDVAGAERAAAAAAAGLREAGVYAALGHAGSTGPAGADRWVGPLVVDPVLGAAVAAAQVRGLQGRDAGRSGRIGPGHAMVAAPLGVGRDGSWHERTLRSTMLAGAEAMVRAGAAIVVPSTAANAGVPGHADSWLLREVLRDEWGFSGIVVAAAGGPASLVSPHRVVGSASEALALAVEAGVDVIGSGVEDMRRIVELVGTGALPEWLVDESAGAVLQLKFRLGLLDGPTVREIGDDDRPSPPRVTRSLVLLSDPTDALPLGPGVVDVVTAAGDAPESDRGDPGGGMPWGVGRDGHRFGATSTSPRPDAHELGRALKVLLPQTLVRTGSVPDLAEDRSGTPGTVVVVANDPRAAAPLAGRVAASGRRCVVLVCSDRIDLLDELATTTATVLLCWGPLGHHADAVAEVLAGLTEPEGRLPMALPPVSAAAAGSARSVVFPLGHGTGYTTFRYGGLRIAPGVLLGRESVRVRCTVTNTGRRAGRDVVQVYADNHTGSIARTGPTLVGFAPVRLAAGQTLSVSVPIPPERLAGWDRWMRHVLHPGTVEVQVGRSAHDIRLTGTLTIGSSGVVRG